MQRSATIPALTSGTFTYDPNDSLSIESYDNNGNTLRSGSSTYSYDSANRLTLVNASVAFEYGGDGNLVSKTVGGATREFLVDELSPTGYPEIAEELVGGAVDRSYVYGRTRISEHSSSGWGVRYYTYDGTGSVRVLTDSSGRITDSYEYDGWGNLIGSTGSTPNEYRYRGERFDVDSGLYYLRTRWYNPRTGRFLTRDPQDAGVGNPSNHRYLYGNADPVNEKDPTGRAACPVLICPSNPVPPAAPGDIDIVVGGPIMEYGTLLLAIDWSTAIGIYGTPTFIEVPEGGAVVRRGFTFAGAAFICIMKTAADIGLAAADIVDPYLDLPISFSAHGCVADRIGIRSNDPPNDPDGDGPPLPNPDPDPDDAGDPQPACPMPEPIYYISLSDSRFRSVARHIGKSITKGKPDHLMKVPAWWADANRALALIGYGSAGWQNGVQMSWDEYYSCPN